MNDRLIGRAGFLGLLGAGTLGLFYGRDVQSFLGRVVPQQIQALVPTEGWRIYTIGDSMPNLRPASYRLDVGGMVGSPQVFALEDLKSLPRAEQVSTFHCVTGWTVSNVHWAGFRIKDLLDQVKPRAGATAIRFTSAEPGYVRRFTVTERVVHWTHATAFFALLASGLVLYLPSLSTWISRRNLVKNIHIWTAVAWAVALVAVFVVGNRRALREAWRDVETLDRDDRRWLRGAKVPQGRFNAGQKVNVILTVAFALLFALSGFFLWLGERDTAYRLDGAVTVHDTLMFVSLLLLVGHLYLAVIHPTTRHALRGITRGDVREDWARKHHSKWVGPES